MYALRSILKAVRVSIAFRSKPSLKFLKHCAGAKGTESLRPDRTVLVYAQPNIRADLREKPRRQLNSNVERQLFNSSYFRLGSSEGVQRRLQSQGGTGSGSRHSPMRFALASCSENS